MMNPIERGDAYKEALACYNDLADEVVVINSGDKVPDPNMRNALELKNRWGDEFDWKVIGRTFQKGYEAATGDWVLHADLDFIFHERDFKALRQAMEENIYAPALSLWKYQFILPDRYTIKSRLILAINKKECGDRIRFDSGGDLCQPSYDGKLLTPDDVPEARIPFYNYEKLIKTREQIMSDQGRMERAYRRHFGHFQLADHDSDAAAYHGWLEMMIGRFDKPAEHIKLEDHPKYIQQTIRDLKPDQFGYNGFGVLGTPNDYVKGLHAQSTMHR